MKHKAEDIMWDLDIAGMKNSVILIETEMEIPDFSFLKGKNNFIFSPCKFDKVPDNLKNDYSVFFITQSITEAYKAIKVIGNHSFDFIVLNRIDMMNLNLSPKDRGALVKAYVSMMCSPNILRDGNLIITSQRQENRLREIADKHYTI